MTFLLESQIFNNILTFLFIYNRGQKKKKQLIIRLLQLFIFYIFTKKNELKEISPMMCVTSWGLFLLVPIKF